MGKLSVFNFTSLNGFYKGPNGDLSWHKQKEQDPEEMKYTKEGAQSGNILLFGRVTYEMMIQFWPTEQAMKTMPEVAKGMNEAEKIVFSKTLKKADWNNTRIVSGDIAEEVKKLKNGGKDMTILGSGTIVSQLADEGLIDSFEIMVDPVAIPEGTPMFHGTKHKIELELTGTRAFKSGVVLHSYKKG
jgi:dihydrofolate reductase